MSLQDDIMRDTRVAMKGRDRLRVEALRMLTAALKNGEIEKGRSLTEDEELAILRRQLKQREDAAKAFSWADREQQARAEAAEAKIVRRYLPSPLSDEELEAIVEEAIRETGATSMRDMSTAMARATAHAGKRVEGKRLAALMRGRLQN
ncbi:MAG: GatB/YqeY domain-containing protein [Rubrobacter sp.]|nr:GatB/YqeY domain-containing protein [Rubrobacter sp.]